ncbi:ATP-dependent RNA helicase A [Tetranychus urticae]|uniref:RNA helicase n=1 Tax=Tetranychus urticae TaxID=32264 RepID=T1KW35_TETUR|nr:ATP-dependent RNA helicase A [Tetranychus urticae]
MTNREKEELKSGLIKANLPPAVYATNQMGNQKRFMCRITVKNLDYVGIGTASNKEQAESTAARDLIAHLRYKGLIDQDTLSCGPPVIQLDSMPPLEAHNTNIPVISKNNTSLPPVSTQSTNIPLVLTHNTSMAPDSSTLHDPTLDCNENETFWFDRIPEEANLAQKRKKIIELDNSSESLEGWTLDNCKHDLGNFAIANGIKLNYNYQSMKTKSGWYCILSFFVKQLGHELKAQAFAQNKKMASKSCAFQLITKLYHHGLIKPSNYTIKDKQAKDKVTKYLNAPVATLPPPKWQSTQSASFDKEKIESKKHIGWCPPTPIWDAWLGRETTGLLCKMSLQQISIGLSICNSVLNSPMKMRITYEQSILPVWNYRSAILSAISNNPVVFICGSIACGKTTQVPQFILDDFIAQGNGALCNILMTQQRHSSAISVAERIAYERCEHFKENSSVGYNIGRRRMTPRPFGAILFCTIDILLKKMEDGLRGISHIIIDELHEPNSNKDFLLTVLRGMIQDHPKLRVIFMGTSFGITAQRRFPDSPIIKITC